VLTERFNTLGDALTSPDITRGFLKYRLAPLEHEVFTVIYLTNQHNVIACKEMFRGTIDGASVYPREIVKEALALNAAAVIFAHNHPSGVAEPSSADLAITKKLRDVFNGIDIRTLDHFLIAGNRTISFAEMGLM
jgi:DNA repair protein RadC